MQQGINNRAKNLCPVRYLSPSAEAFLFLYLTAAGVTRAAMPGGNLKKTGLFVLLLTTSAGAQFLGSGFRPRQTRPTTTMRKPPGSAAPC